MLAALLGATSSYIPATTVNVNSTDKCVSPYCIAEHVCQGLYSRNASAAVYIINGANDETWLNFTGGSAPATVSPAAFVTQCLIDFPRYVRYNITSQQELLPEIVTMASSLSAVALEINDLKKMPDLKAAIAFDAITTFAGFKEIDAVGYAYDHFGNTTTGIAKLNPGWRWDNNIEHQLTPTLTGGPSLSLVDYVVKERLFCFFLKNGCIQETPEHKLMERMLNDHNPWPRPIVVYGYDNSHPLFGGDVFEAETTCVKEHNMGQVASEGCSNLAFFSSKHRIVEPLVQTPDPPLTFNGSKSYVALIVGDGDNVQYVQHSRFGMIQERARRCAAGGGADNRSACFPLLWSLSPALLHLAPQMARWYFDISRGTGADWFVLPPSGDTYSYPSQQSPTDQATFILRTEEDCRLMNTSASTTWETTHTWAGAIRDFYPQYAQHGVVRSLYAVNVPYDLPVLAFGENEHYKILGDVSDVSKTPSVLFKPQEWRGEHCADAKGSPPFSKYSCPTAQEMADRLNGFKAGAVSAIYMTSDGGANLDTLYKLVALLGEHVAVVNQNQLGRMALEAKKRE